MDLEIRFIEEKDIDDVLPLLLQVHKVHSDKRPDLFKVGAKKYTRDELLDLISKRDDRPIFVAIKNSHVVGYAFTIKQENKNSNNMNDIKTLYIDDLCVDSHSRGLHIGTLLYKKVLEFAKNNDFYNVTLNVWACNTDAINFYKKLGLEVQKIGMEKIL